MCNYSRIQKYRCRGVQDAPIHLYDPCLVDIPPVFKKCVLFCFLFHYNFIDYCQQETKANQVRVQHLLRYFLTPYTPGIYCISPSYIRNKGTKTLNNALETNSKSHMAKNKTPACSHGPTYMWRTALLLQQQLRGR